MATGDLFAIRHSPSETDAKEEAPARWGCPGLGYHGEMAFYC
jgi:hypothetical protein